jgi:hypothetical protein
MMGKLNQAFFVINVIIVVNVVGIVDGYTTPATTKTPNVDKPGKHFFHWLY